MLLPFNSEDAFSYLATKCYQSNPRLKLFRLRPKIHFQQHLLEILRQGPCGFNIWSPSLARYGLFLALRFLLLE